MDHFISGYVGLNFVDTPRHGAPPPVDIVSGATVTLMVIGDSITRSAIAVARAHGVGKAARPAQAATARVQARTVDETPGEVRSWQALLDNGAVRQLRLSVADVNQAFRASGRDDAAAHAESRDEADAFIELYVAQVSAPAIGRSLLGETGWLRLKERQARQQAVLVAGGGLYSFKGSGYVRGGIFDRVEIVQHDAGFRFRDRDHQRLADIAAEGAPALREVALFVVPQDALFDPVAPWRLQLMVQRVLSVSDKAFVTFDLDYALPDVYTRAAPASAGAAAGPATATPASQASSAGAPRRTRQRTRPRPNCGARSGTASRCRSPS